MKTQEIHKEAELMGEKQRNTLTKEDSLLL